MLILFTILVVLSAVITVSVWLSNQKDRKTLSSDNPKEIEPPQFRSLFEPNEEEIRALEREEKARIAAQKDEKAKRVSAQKQEKVRKFQEIWASAPDKKNTIELIYLASESESGKIFSEIAENVVKLWQAKKIEDFSGDDLAQILESHFWLLPNEERTSGVSFWLKQEIAGLRTSPAGKN
jgi:hypothetical protein